VAAGPEFDAWQADFWRRFGQDPPLAYIAGDQVALVEGSAEHRVLVYADDGALEPLLALLQADRTVVAISIPGPRAGFRPVERWEHRFDLKFAPAEAGPPPEGYEVRAWDPERASEAGELLASANGNSIDGLFLTWPDVPTQARCQRLVTDFQAGSQGPFSPGASLMALRDEKLVGLTLMSLPSRDEALLFEIAVRLRHRGKGLAPYLLARFKTYLAAQGYRWVRFLACGHNAAVLALFKPEEVRSERMDGGWIWVRELH